ncbi:MAG: UDP-N-acetylmuramate--L-alanine ligase [Candidatus Scalindua sp.]|nr:UDP-N-acetylmuramate--L-alanine ligase [Planctomycetota bacterium]GJQ57996.1 MAG: UDP-N-acetylmuramate--L-alanine ligase [Candidatus Scalindua sp.]
MKGTKEVVTYHFVGIGGIGMSALAQIIRAQGHRVSGSDRSNDNGLTPEIFRKLELHDIKLYPQDGSGISHITDIVVISSAIEEDNRDQKRALEMGIRIVKRSELLSGLFNQNRGIAVGGSNGKTSVCGMIGWILSASGYDPTVVGGGYLKNYIETSLGNARFGNSDCVVIEADESDGSLVTYKPKVSVITDISKDHQTVDELKKLFCKFADNTSEVIVIHEKCAHFIKTCEKGKKIITYGEGNNADIRAYNLSCNPVGSRFEVDGKKFEIHVPGLYNVLNALASIAVAQNEGIPDDEIDKALRVFKGIKRRMDFVGQKNGVKIIDDYAHNPKKIQMAINAARLYNERLIIIFQPHGYAPTKFLRDDFISTFETTLLPTDILYMPEIFYAGGTADKTISSKDIIDDLKDRGFDAFYFRKREQIIGDIQKKASPGNTVLVMGARDDSLTNFCHSLLSEL